MDFATLTLGAETAGLEKGERSLDSVTAAAGRAEKAADGVAGGFDRAGAAASKSTREQKSYQEALRRTQAALGTNVRSFEELRRAIDPSYAASQKYAEVQRLVSSSVAAGEASQQAANVVLQEAARRYMGVVPAAERAAAAQQKAAQEAKDMRAAYEATRASLDPLFAASKRYEATIESLNAAQKAGVISDKERVQTLSLLEARMIGSGREVVRVTGRFDALFASVGGGQFALKQTAFQLNQVAQQGAVTGDYMGALSIQAADMLTIFGTWGILAGGVIAVMGPLAMSLFDTGKGAKDAAKGLDKLEGASRAYIDIAEITRAKTGDLRKEYGKHAEAVREVHRELVKVAEQMALNQMDAAIAEASESLDALMVSVGQLSEARKELGAALAARDEGGFLPKAELDALELQVSEILAEIQVQFGLTSAEAYRVKDAIDAINAAATKEEAAEAARRLSLAISSAYEGSRRIPDEMGKIATAAGRVFSVFARIVSVSEETSVAADEIADEIGAAAVEALKLANVDIEKGVSAAAKEAAILAANLGVSLNAAINLSNLQASKEYSGRGGDPRKFAEASYQQALGYQSVDEVVKELTKSTNKLGGATRSGLAALQQDIQQRTKLLGLSGDQRAQYQALITVQQRLGKDASKYSKAQIEGLAGQLFELEKLEAQQQRVVELQNRWSEEITRTAFEGGSLTDTIEGMLRDIAYQFAHSRIVLPIIAQITGVLGLDQLLLGVGGQQAAGAAAGGGGGLLNLVGGAGNLIGGGGFAAGFASGLGGILSGGGLGASFATLGGLATGSAGFTAGAFGAALPALGIIIGAAALLKKGFSRKFAYSALEGTIDLDGFDGFGRDFYKGGFFRSDRSNYSALDPDVSSALDQQANALTGSLLDLSEALGLGRDTLDDYEGYFVSVMTSGRTQEQIQQDLARHFEIASDQMAEMILGTDEWSRAGETAIETLTRLGSSLLAVNDAMDLLGHTAFETSLAGGDAASDLIDMFGGQEAFTAATSAYWNGFYTEAERIVTATRLMQEQFQELGLSMPESRAGFRQLVESIDLTSESGRQLYADLMAMSGALDQLLPQESAFSTETVALMGQVQETISDQISLSRDAAREARQTAQLWFRAAESLQDFLDGLLNSNLTTASPQQVLARNQARFQGAYTLAMGGDIEAAQDLTGFARGYLDSLYASATSSVEYRRIAAQVQAQVGQVAAVADATGSMEERLAGLLDDQVSVLTDLGEYLQTADASMEGFDQNIVSYQDRLEDLGADIMAASQNPGIAEVSPTGDMATLFGALTGGLLDVVGPMGMLSSMLGELRDAVEAESELRRTQQRIARLQVRGADAVEAAGSGQRVVDEFNALRSQYGISLVGQNGTVSVNDDGRIVSSFDYYGGTEANLAAFKEALREEFGTDAMGRHFGATNTRVGNAEARAERLREQIRGLGEIPAFANGGMHRGGLARVGENDIELVAPSRIYNPADTRAMLDNREVVAELRKLRREVAELRDDNEQLMLANLKHNKRSGDALTRFSRDPGSLKVTQVVE